MSKFNDWLRIKLKEFLNIDDIESNFSDHEVFNNIRFNDIEKELNDKIKEARSELNNFKINQTNFVYEINNYNKKVNHLEDSVKIIHNTIENVVHIGTDVYENPHGRSWAVVCVEGKMNLVKFVDLSDRKYAMDILHYLKQYEAGRHCIDTPHKEFFYDGLFKF